MTDTTLTPARLWKGMTSEQRLKAARAFWATEEEDAADAQFQAVFLIAQQKKFRAKSVFAMDDERKAKQLASLHTVPEVVAARALIVYHLAEQRPMMGAFLDALGITHEDGVIKDDEVKPNAGKIGPASDQLAKAFPPADISLYFNTLLCQDPDTWGGLRGVVEGLTHQTRP
jgi:hypothetical protein